MNAPEDQNGLREALARAEARAKKAERALVSLTPDGSEYYSRVRDEYHVDVDACLRFIRAAREDKHALVVRTIKAQRAAEAEITRLKEGMEAAKPKVWVVTNNERGAERRYRMWSGRAWVWTADPAQAAHFARKTDANQILPDGCPFDYADRIATLSSKEQP